jgi:hypothetical protein
MFVLNPFRRFFHLYQQVLSLHNVPKTFLFLLSGAAIGWWLYVPIHELLHAGGCLVAGGEVHRLEINPLYGGAIFSQLFSFVSSGGDYAGRLTGFDTHGSDWTYGLLVFFPFILSFFGFIFLELGTRKKAAFVFALFLPIAFAPLISLTGDFFELGSLLVFQMWPGPEEINRALISDDIFRLVNELSSGALGLPFRSASLSFIVMSFLTGCLLAWVTLLLSDALRALVCRFMTLENEH